jgi:IS30 family transposase
MSYTQLSIAERHQLYQLKFSTNLSMRKIAEKLGRNQSTVSRELGRNTSNEGLYLPDSAQQKMEERREQSKVKFRGITECCISEIKLRLKEYHSPEQISGRMKRDGLATISHETIYQMIYADYQGLRLYQKYLRQGKGKRRKRVSSKSSRGRIVGRVGIENRPAIANEKTEIGHWESDTMIGGNHEGVIVTHVDKASKFLIAGLGRNKTSKQINQVTIELFKEVPDPHKKTMTFDNGKEFSGHAEISKSLGVDCYFANPYSSWERGLNEHTNGLLRQFFPKQTNFKAVKPEELEKAVHAINNRPRKSLDYRTPFEVFFGYKLDADALQI